MPRLETLRAKVGATILDVMRPGWAREIDTKTLDLSMCSACVLGQLYGHFDSGAEKLFAMRKTNALVREVYLDPGLRAATQDAGFFAPGLKGEEKDAAYATLTVAWRREIAKRTAKRSR